MARPFSFSPNFSPRLPTWLTLACLVLGTLVARAQSPVALTCEHRTNPLGLDVRQPRLSWKMEATGRNVRQAAYQLRVATAADFAPASLVWATGKVSSAESILREYAGKALQAGTRYYWQVKLWDGAGRESPWSAVAHWEMGLLAPADWTARWIGFPAEPDPKKFTPGVMLRKSFSLKKTVADARAYVTAAGMYELRLNGQRVGDELLTPGWTSYATRTQYQVYDVTSLLQPGLNAAGALLGEGWYRSSLGWEDRRAFYGNRLALLCQIRVRYTDGSQEIIGTDATWRTTQDGPIRHAEIYFGEEYDARREPTGWDKPGFDDRAWARAAVANLPLTNLVASAGVPVRRQQVLTPRQLLRTPNGTWVADMGQNMVGWVRLRVRGAAGTTLTLRHAEVLDKKGNFYVENLRSASQRLTYTLRGGGEETFEPHFTFYGFRYVALDGLEMRGEPSLAHLTGPDGLAVLGLEGVVVHSDMPVTGSFTCSNPLLNQLQQNITWGQKGNFVDVPTDCPQRDERLGWTGDAQAFCRTAALNMDVAAFFTKWLRDVATDQYPNGGVPFVVPDVTSRFDKVPGTSAGWGDVAVITPWVMYQQYGDRRLLATQYPSMKAYVEHIRTKAGAGNVWRGGSVFGDWLFYHPFVTSHPEPDGYTDGDYIATAFYAYSTQLLSQAAAVLGKADEAAAYQALFARIRDTFAHEYITPAGRTAADSQTSYVLALMFDLLPVGQRAAAATHLVADIRRRNNHLSTGFLGTPYLCHVLSQHGHTNVAYDLLLQQTYPSWLYPVKMGATTIWERWDGMKPDSTFQDAGMNSFNHYAYGAVGEWMYRVVAGLELGTAGYQHIRIQPQLPTEAQLTHARATLSSPYGEIASGWSQQEGKLTLTVQIPPNTTATVRLPRSAGQAVREGDQPLVDAKTDGPDTTLEIGSGTYVYTYALSK